MGIFELYQQKLEQNFKEVWNDSFFKRITQKWFFPENNILPPCFQSNIEDLWKNKYYFPLKRHWETKELQWLNKWEITELITITTPKWAFHERVFGILEPKKYHDITKHLLKERIKIQKKLFSKKNKIFSYWFPFPPECYPEFYEGEVVSIKTQKRGGQFINSFIEAENNLLSISHNYKFILKTDIKNFYPSIYTHSIAWVIETKEKCREKIWDMSLLWNRIDQLLQKAHDNCTNGIAIWPILSDFIWEILLNNVDIELSKNNKKKKFLWIRFKDDYKILTDSEQDAKDILKDLGSILKKYNLHLHEDKTEISNNLPENLFRPRIIEVDNLYRQYINEIREDQKLIRKEKIWIKKIKEIYLKLLLINNQYPNHGIFEKMLSKMIYKWANQSELQTCFNIKQNELSLFISLLIQLKDRRLQTLPLILGIYEILLKDDKKSIIYDSLKRILDTTSSEYEIIRLLYFFRKQDGRWHNSYKNRFKAHQNKFITSIANNRQDFFNTDSISLFNNNYNQHWYLREQISVFWYEQLT